MSDEEETPQVEPVQEWVIVQKKSFTRLINRYFKNPNDQIQDLAVDFKDGKKLLKLLKNVLDTTVPDPERGSSRLHFVNTVNKAFAVMKRYNVKIVDVGAEEIVDGNLKMTLGMTWAIIVYGFIENIKEGGASAKDGLLLWCQKKTKNHKNVKIKDFSPSWKNGLGFCALIHAHRPDLIDYDSLTPENAARNLELAFSVAKENFEIERILEVEDIVGTEYPDDKSVMAYVSLFYHYFSKFNDVENAAKRLQMILEMNDENQRLIDVYESGSSELVRWMKEKLPFLTDRCGESPNAEDVKKKYVELHEFRSKEKPPKADEKAKLESDYQTLQTRLNIQNRPQYIPPEELNPKFIDDLWKEVERQEQDLLNWLEDMMNLMEKIQYLLNRFYYKCNKQEEWMRGISGDVDGSKLTIEMGLSELQGLSKKFKTTESEVKSRENRINYITSLKDEISQLQYSKFAEIQARYDDIMQQWNTLATKVQEYSTNLGDITSKAQKLDEARVEYSACASELRNWLDDATEDYGDEHKPQELKEIDKWKSDHQAFTQSVSSYHGKLNRLKEYNAEITSITTTPNPYCSIAADQLQTRFTELEGLIEKRTLMLDDEYTKVKASSDLRAEFNDLVTELDAWKKAFTARVSNILLDKSGTLESKKGLLQAHQTEIENYVAQNLTKLDSLNEKITAIGALNWERSANTTMSVKSGFETTVRSITSMQSELENQIVVRDSSGISSKEMEDINMAFRTFAKEDKNCLNHEELLNCLIALGFNLKLESAENEEFNKAVSVVDPLGTGRVSQSALIAYVTSQRKSADNASEISESFKSMANGKEFILPEEIRRALAPKHADNCIKQMKPYTDDNAPPTALDYRSYAENIFGESDV